jgi:mannose-6-phosphate isomerase-like protein (cupin superfamily)
MDDFPAFMKNPKNRIARASQFTDGIDGYVFDGADGSQVAFWSCSENRSSKPHAHPFDEYMLVIQGSCVLHLGEERIALGAGEEFFVPKGTLQSVEVTAGTRTLHVFGGRRARRESELGETSAD